MPSDVHEIDRAVGLLQAGELVAFPTETVYGLGADAANPTAVGRIFAAKGRPADHPLIVHLPADGYLDRWARDTSAPKVCGAYVAMLAAEGPHAIAKATDWLASKDDWARVAGWGLLGQLVQREETLPDSWFVDRLGEIERTIHHAPNAEREAMNAALIAIGCRNETLRKSATTVAKRIGKVHIDHGDTACKTPDAAAYIEKTWAHSLSKGFESPAAHERTREVPRLRC